MFENFTEIAAIRRALLELDMIENKLKRMKQAKANVVDKPKTVKVVDSAKAFVNWNKERAQRRPQRIPDPSELM